MEEMEEMEEEKMEEVEEEKMEEMEEVKEENLGSSPPLQEEQKKKLSISSSNMLTRE